MRVPRPRPPAEADIPDIEIRNTCTLPIARSADEYPILAPVPVTSDARLVTQLGEATLGARCTLVSLDYESALT